MEKVVGLIFLFVVLAVAIFSGFGAIATIHSTNTQGCAYNASGSLVNCSLSNADYLTQNKTATAAANIFQTLTALEWVVLAGVFISLMLVLLSLKKK